MIFVFSTFDYEYDGVKLRVIFLLYSSRSRCHCRAVDVFRQKDGGHHEKGGLKEEWKGVGEDDLKMKLRRGRMRHFAVVDRTLSRSRPVAKRLCTGCL